MRHVSVSGHYSSVASNRHDEVEVGSSHQYGGCAATIFNQVAHAAKDYGRDPSGMGRWAWVRIRGKKMKSDWPQTEGQIQPSSRDLVVISAYRPNLPGAGESTVWATQRLHLLRTGKKGQPKEPRKAFTKDLMGAIRNWRSEGCEVILGVDANEDLSNEDPDSFRFFMKQVGLHEAVLERHRGTTQATYQRNLKAKPIDGIFVSSGIPVSAAGYYEFDSGPPSDHRALWIDFDLKTCLGGHTPTPNSFQPRRLTNEDPKAVHKYVKAVEAAYRQYSIPQRVRKLRESLQQNDHKMTASMKRKFNCLHSQMYAIRRKAEEKCRKIKKGKVPWSPRMQAMWDEIKLWRILIKSKKGCRVSSRKIRRLMKKLHRPTAWKLTMGQMEDALKEIQCAYNKAKHADAAQWRKDHITSRMKAARKIKWRSKKARGHFLRLRRMKQREEARRRRRAQGKGYSGGLRAIQVEEKDKDGQVRLVTIEDRALVEEGCRRENTARYDQTRSPFCTPPMEDVLFSHFTGPSRESNSRALMEGSWSIPTNIEPTTQRFLSHCRFHRGFEPSNLAVSMEDHASFWSKNKENKGSEPHGLHNGHYKAALRSKAISKCDAIMRDIPMSTGFVPKNWRHLTNFAIEKKPGDFRLSKMRTIQLMNSEFQANTKKIGRTAMKFAEKHNLIPPGQCGARKKHQAIDLAVSKRMIWDLLILQRRSAGWISNDAKSCFDRVVHWVAVLALLRFGITWRAVAMAFDTLAKSKHRVRTGFGDSPTVFDPPSAVSFQGCGQGNGAGPAIWVAVSSIIIIMMEAAGFGFEALTALDSRLVTAQCLAFIDDTDVVEAAKSVLVSGADLCPSIQRAATLWSGGIRATGGAINPDKSFWWLIEHKWNPSTGKFDLCSIKQASPDFELKIQGLSGQLEPLRRLEPEVAERTLGVMLAPLDNSQAHIEYVTDIAVTWAEKLRPGHLQRYDVIPLIKTTVMKSLEYPMPLMTIDKTSWKKIMSPILRVCLPKAGINRNFSRRVALAPLSLQGLGVPHPFGLQVVSHLDILLRHPANRTQTSRYLEANLQAHQLETGTSYGLFQQNYDNTAILASDTLLKRYWAQFEPLDIHVVFDSPSLGLHRHGDQTLVEYFMDLEVDQEDLKWLNWCRMVLNVSTLSDVVTADGTHIHHSVWNGKKALMASDRCNWPRVPVKLAPRHWKLWQKTLATLLRSNSPGSPLKNPLGPWTDDLSRWNYLWLPDNSLLCRHGHLWQHLPPLLPRRSCKRFDVTSSSIWTKPIPPNAKRASIRRISPSQLQLTGVGLQATPNGPPSSILHIWDRLVQDCSETYGWVPDDIQILGSEKRLSKALAGNRLRVISDGSFDEEVGTAAIQLTTKSCRDRIVIRCQVPGLPEDQSAYRSELVGIMVGMTAVNWLLMAWSIRGCRPQVRLGCDGLSALHAVFEKPSISPTDSQFDVISTCRAIIHKSKASWLPRHVDGHQDRKSTEPLDWWELRNIEVDHWAVQFRHNLDEEEALHPPNPKFFHEPAALFIHGVKQSRLDPNLIQELVALPALRARWREYKVLTAEAESELDWKTLKRAMHSLPSYLQRWVTKHSVGTCGVGKCMVAWGFDTDSRCPCCGILDEDHHHVPRCPDRRVQREWDKRLTELETWMEVNDTDPAIQQAILTSLKQVRSPATDPPTSPRSTVLEALKSQQLIGSQGLLEGRLSNRWIPIQQDFYRRTRSQRSAALWASRLTQQIILVGYHLWEHRNSVKHSKESIQFQDRLRKVNNGIILEFEKGPDDLPPFTRPMMLCKVSTVLAKPLLEKEKWLSLVRLERDNFRHRMSSQRRIMTSFFTRPSS